MKKIIFILALISLTVLGAAQDRTGRIPTGFTMLDKVMAFTAADSIVTSDSLVILVTNPQKYLQHQTVTTTLTNVDGGSPSVVITLRGRTTSTDNWHPIGTAVTWTSVSNNPATITSTVPKQYNYLKVSYVASGATQHLRVATFEVRTAFVYDVGKISAMVLGDGTGTIAVNSSDWDISATGVQTGMGAITSNGLITGTAGATLSGAAINLNASSNFATNIGTGTTNAAVTIGGGSNTVAINSSAWDISTAGAVTGLTDVTASGVITGGFKHLAPIANTDASETLTAAQTGAFVVCSNAAGSTTITIPDASAATVGVIYYIVQTADQNLIVTATTANNNSIVCDGVATSDNVTISTASHKIGAGMIVIGISSTQWYIGGLNPESVLTPEAAD